MVLPGRRDFSLVFSSYALSSLGDYLALVTLTLKVQEATASGWAVSALLLAGLLPLVLFAPVAGLLVDRVETVRLLSVTAIAQAGVATALAFTDELPLILALVALLGIGMSITQPALQVLVPRTVPEERITRANGSMEVARWVTTPIGAVLAGWLTARFGSRPTLLADAASFLVVGVAILALRVRRPAAERPGGSVERGEWRRGIAFIGGDPLLRLLVLVLGAMVAFASVDNVAEVFFAKGELRAGRIGYGSLVGAWTLGIALGAWICGRYVRPPGLAPAIMAASFAGGAAVFAAAGIATFPVAIAMFLIGGAANGCELVAMRSVIHHRVPDHVRGRVFSAYYAVVNGGQIIALGLGGAVLEWLGPGETLLLAGGGAMGVALLGWVGYRGLPRAARRTELSPSTPLA